MFQKKHTYRGKVGGPTNSNSWKFIRVEKNTEGKKMNEKSELGARVKISNFKMEGSGRRRLSKERALVNIR